MQASVWQVSQKDDECRLVRSFEADGERISMMISQSGPSEVMNLMFVGKFAGELEKHGTATLQFGPELAPFSQAYSSANLESGAPTINFYQAVLGEEKWQLTSDGRIQALASGQARGVEWLTLSQDGETKLTLPMDGLDDIFAIMAQCNMNLVSKRAPSEGTETVLARSPRMLNGSEIGMRLLGANVARMARETVRVEFSVGIDAMGAVTDCDYEAPNRNRQLGDHVCDTVRRLGRFLPAVGLDMRPTPGRYHSATVFPAGN